MTVRESRRRLRVLGAALSATASLVPTAAVAEKTAGAGCQTFDRGAARADVTEILVKYPGRWVRVCRGADGGLEHAVLSAPVKDGNGVCHFREQRVFAEERNGVVGWVTVPSNVPRRAGLGEPLELMSKAAGGCPEPDSGAYVRTHGLSVQRFAEIERFNARIGASTDRFEQAFAGVDGVNAKDLYFQRFEFLVLGKAAVMSSVRLDYDLPGSSRKVYVIMFSDPQNDALSFRIAVDFASGRPLVQSFSTAIA